MSFWSYWRVVAIRAAKDTWRSMVKHSPIDILRSALSYAATFGLAYWANTTLVDSRLMSADNTQDTFIWFLLATVALGMLFAANFTIHVLFITPYRMWCEVSVFGRPAPANQTVVAAPQENTGGPLGLSHERHRKFPILGLERRGDSVVVAQFNVQGTNLTRAPIRSIDGYVRSDVTGELVPILFNVRGQLHSGSELAPIPVTANFSAAAKFAAPIPIAEFLSRFATFTMVLKYEDALIERQFTRGDYDMQIDEYNKALRDKDASSARAITLSKPNLVPLPKPTRSN